MVSGVIVVSNGFFIIDIGSPTPQRKVLHAIIIESVVGQVVCQYSGQLSAIDSAEKSNIPRFSRGILLDLTPSPQGMGNDTC